MRVAIPHQLGREEVRRRIRGGSHQIADFIPGGLAEVHTDWEGEDRMLLAVGAMGQSITGHIEIEDEQVLFVVELPPALSFVESIVANAIRDKGQKMLSAPE